MTEYGVTAIDSMIGIGHSTRTVAVHGMALTETLFEHSPLPPLNRVRLSACLQ